jgi:hypothetical protein
VVEREDAGDDEGGAFVAVDKAVVAGDAERVGGGDIGDVRNAVGGPVLRAGEGGLHQREITDAGVAAVFSDLCVVDGEDNVLGEPAPRGRRHFDRIVELFTTVH